MEIKSLLDHVKEAKLFADMWRPESWRDQEMYDGKQWTDEMEEEALEKGIDPITINRTFPVVNLILGSQTMNKFDMVAKGRTIKDSELSQTVSEGLQFVMDQNGGEHLISEAFGNQVIPGFGCLYVGENSDPRRERIAVRYRDWKEIWWDPFGSPWFDPQSCRYVFYQKWINVDDLKAAYPKYAKDVEDKFENLTEEGYTGIYDEAQRVEEARRQWASKAQRRVRPVEFWYTKYEQAVFARFLDGRVIEIQDAMPVNQQYEMIRSSQEVIKATIKRMHVATFLHDLILDDKPSPYKHDQFPFVPFVCYVDRFGCPYGVPRQIRGQNIEVNKRRSMAMALLSKRRTLMEEGAVPKGREQETFEEANKPDGFILLGPNKMNSIKIEEQAEFAATQMRILESSEREILELSGANPEVMGYESNAITGRAIDKRVTQGNIVTAPIFNNLRRSMATLGKLVVALMQGYWTSEKVLRITDRLTGAEKFVEINKQIRTDGGITILNDITQGVYDIIISLAPMTDTVRERNMEMLIEWVKKSPPEIIPHLVHAAFEMSNLPNKDSILQKLKPVLGIDPREEDLSPQQIKEKIIQELESQQQAQQEMMALEKQKVELEIEGMALENKRLEAEIYAKKVGADSAKVSAEAKKGKTEIDGFKAGYQLEAQKEQQRMQAENLKRQEDRGRDTSGGSKGRKADRKGSEAS